MKTISFSGTHPRGATEPPTHFPPVPFSPERLASGRWSTTRYKNKKKGKSKNQGITKVLVVICICVLYIYFRIFLIIAISKNPCYCE
jgi:hypothetical protein